MFDEADVVSQFTSLPLTFLLVFPILILLAPSSHVFASNDFNVYRMEQFDLQGIAHGCRSAVLNLEARSLDAKALTRKCVVLKWTEFTLVHYRQAVQQAVGAILVILPANLSSLTAKEREEFAEMEATLLADETALPVYFTWDTPQVSDMYAQLRSNARAETAATAAEAILGSVFSNGYQLIVASTQSTPITNAHVINIHGTLSGSAAGVPTVVVSAHYDALGVAPSLSFGADSNGSGVVALLELARIFSRLYAQSRTRPKYNMVFLLSGGGTLNYQGTKSWIAAQLDHDDEASVLQDVHGVICLDRIGSPSDELYMHVAKVPKNTTSFGKFLNRFEVGAAMTGASLKTQQKKINLADTRLAWHHEQWSIRRLPAATLSSTALHKDAARYSMLDTAATLDVERLIQNIRTIAESLASEVYGSNSNSSFDAFSSGSLAVNRNFVTSWMDFITTVPRSPALVSQKGNMVEKSLTSTLSRFLEAVKATHFNADERDPEFVLYTGSSTMMNAYSVKPAVFDLVLGIAIATYLGIVYIFILNFKHLYSLFARSIVPVKMKPM